MRERSERAAGLKRQACATFLGAVHKVYEGVSTAYRDQADADQRRQLLRSISSSEGQVALDTLRLTVDRHTMQDAEKIWRHVRGGGTPTGRTHPDKTIGEWKTEYRTLRWEFLDNARLELCLPRVRVNEERRPQDP
ncbi:hypothetical protein GCM10009609_75980 [Pseudonocardia aurantiaca]